MASGLTGRSGETAGGADPTGRLRNGCARPLCLPKKLREVIEASGCLELSLTHVADDDGERRRALALHRRLADSLERLCRALDDASSDETRHHLGRSTKAESKRVQDFYRGWELIGRAIGADGDSLLSLIGGHVIYLPEGEGVQVTLSSSSSGTGCCNTEWFEGWIRLGVALWHEAHYRAYKVGRQQYGRGHKRSDEPKAALREFVFEVWDALVDAGEPVTTYQGGKRGRTADLIAILLAAAGVKASTYLKALLLEAKRGADERRRGAGRAEKAWAEFEKARDVARAKRKREAHKPDGGERASWIRTQLEADSEYRAMEARWAACLEKSGIVL